MDAEGRSVRAGGRGAPLAAERRRLSRRQHDLILRYINTIGAAAAGLLGATAALLAVLLR
ncbi:hypothetical protein GCM10023080_067960 [Streptomyces pseudoechinosporeus]